MSQSYILDTSILVQLLIHDTHTPEVRALFRSLKAEDHMVVVEFCLVECVNVLWKHVRFQGLAHEDAVVLVQDLQQLDLQLAPAAPLLPQALEIGLRHSLAIYDAMVLALAHTMKLPLITDDAKQSTAAKREHITLKPITDFAG